MLIPILRTVNKSTQTTYLFNFNNARWTEIFKGFVLGFTKQRNFKHFMLFSSTEKRYKKY